MNPLTVTRIVHASVLLDFGNAKILTDPWFSELYGHHWGEPLGLSLSELPELTGVTVSHKDYDHFDMQTFAAYPDKRVPFIVRRGIADEVKKAGFSNITELEPWESAMLGPVKVTAAPAKHKEDMGVFQNTYILEANGFTVFFGGDSLLIPDFTEVARRFPHIDLALLPTNGLKIRPMLNRRIVMNQSEAAQLCAILQPRYAVPIHYRYEGNWWRKLMVAYQRDTDLFVKEAAKRAPSVAVRVLETGQPLSVQPAKQSVVTKEAQQAASGEPLPLH